MRAALTGDASADEFANKLLRIGNGEIQEDENGFIHLPCGTLVETAEELIQKVYPSLVPNYTNIDWMCERALLAPTNIVANRINDTIIAKIPGQEHEYLAYDSVEGEEQLHFSTEFLNSLEPSGTPVYRLKLKVGVPVLILRNLDPPKLCNGTRCVVKQLLPNVIVATIITSVAKGEDVLIPRISIEPSDMPFTFKRVQFPVRVCFCMTINKAQGQTFRVVGINLEVQCFSHGQLYVACSRVGSENGLFLFSPDKRVKNVVYPRALQN